MSITAEELTINNDQLRTGGHKFVLKHVFENVSKMMQDKYYDSDREDHFGIQWGIRVGRHSGNLGVYLYCNILEHRKKWSVAAEFESCVLHPNGSSVCKTKSYCFQEWSSTGWGDFVSWETIEKEYLVNDKFTVEIRVQMIKIKETNKNTLRTFDDEDCSDVTLVVNHKRFHVSKLYLSTHSSYFKTMFLGGFEESKQAEIKLSGVDANDLHKYLEALYGEDVIDEFTVEEVLLLADMYDTKLLIRKCEKFLLESSKKTLKKKLEMAGRYNLFELKNKCLTEIKTIAGIRSVVPSCVDQMDPSIMAILFEKMLALV